MEQENRFAVYEGHMYDLRKKVSSIQKKATKYGCDFTFREVGEEIRDVKDPNTDEVFKAKYILIEAEGTAVINGWEFVASIEHTAKGNIFSKALTDVEIPERYRTTDCICEHCNTKRSRTNTFIVRNSETGEFKQIGKSCLMDYTHGLSVSMATWFASIKDIFGEYEERPVGGGWCQKFYDTKEILQYTAETIRHFGFSKSDNNGDSTRVRMEIFFNIEHGNIRWMDEDFLNQQKDLMKKVGFDAESPEAVKMVEDALAWLDTQEASNDYMHNLKTACSLECNHTGRFGLLVSLFPTYDRELEYQAKRKQETESGKASQHVGQVGDRIKVEVESVKCLTSWESCYNGYTTQTTYIWKITGKDGNIYTWKTSNWMDEDVPPKTVTGTVKEHKVYREVNQTELTRCRVA